MKNVTLTRFAYSPMGTFGVLRIEGTNFEAYTVELPWVDVDKNGVSDRNVSCIPEGVYPLVPVADADTRVSTAGLGSYIVDQVPGRQGIMFHIGNTIEDILGCVVMGSVLGMPITRSRKRLWGVLNSTDIYKQWMAVMNGEPGTLTVRFTTNRPVGA